MAAAAAAAACLYACMQQALINKVPPHVLHSVILLIDSVGVAFHTHIYPVIK